MLPPQTMRHPWSVGYRQYSKHFLRSRVLLRALIAATYIP
jgi:hypothetical protein